LLLDLASIEPSLFIHQLYIYIYICSFFQRIVKAFTSEKSWGPSDSSDHQEWRKFKLNKRHEMVVTEFDYRKNGAFKL
jgi:hypothetical protein